MDATELVTHFTKEELKTIAGYLIKDWRVILFASAAVFLGGFFIDRKAGNQIKSHIQQLQSTATVQIAKAYLAVSNQIDEQFQRALTSASNRITDAYGAATNQLDEQFHQFAGATSNRISEAHSAITNEIAAQFQTERIKGTIESVAGEQAKSLLITNVEPIVERFRQDAEFLRLATRARSYDYQAYLQLHDLKMSTNDLARYASQVIQEVDRMLDRDKSQIQIRSRRYAVFEGTNFYAGPFTTDEIAEAFPGVLEERSSYNREGFVNTAVDLNEPRFLVGFIQILTNESDITIADKIVSAINALANKTFQLGDQAQIVDWWQTNQHLFTNWPITDLKNGIQELEKGRWASAAQAFDRVLSVDPTADRCRAFSVICHWQLGETNIANEEAKAFKETSGRWARFAAAKAQIDSGSVSNGTVLLVNLYQQQPTMRDLLTRNLSIWRSADWTLFDQLYPPKR